VRSRSRSAGPPEDDKDLAVSALFDSARTGDGIDALCRRMAELAAPTDTAVDVVIPYDRGDLVARVHADGRVALAASLRQFSAT
jgi:50S ribosomal subunit-associated GTPase HflX